MGRRSEKNILPNNPATPANGESKFSHQLQIVWHQQASCLSAGTAKGTSWGRALTVKTPNQGREDENAPSGNPEIVSFAEK